MRTQLTEDADFYYNEQGLIVLTEKFLRNRGFCCGNGCLHCPFQYEAVPEERRLELLAKRAEQQEEHQKPA